MYRCVSVLVVGSARVGKSNLVAHWINAHMVDGPGKQAALEQARKPTVLADFHSFDVTDSSCGEQVRVRVLDCDATHAPLHTKPDVALLVYKDADSARSLLGCRLPPTLQKVTLGTYRGGPRPELPRDVKRALPTVVLHTCHVVTPSAAQKVLDYLVTNFQHPQDCPTPVIKSPRRWCCVQ
jgi:hypothetical protein